MSEQEESVEVVVTSSYDFAARPHLRLMREPDGRRRPTIYPDAPSMTAGAFRVWLDGHPVGMVPALGRVSFKVPPRHHYIRVQFMWYRSPVIHFDVSAGDVITFNTTVSDTFKMRGFVRLLVHPFRALALDRVKSH